MYALAEALKIPLPMAVGMMEMLWDFTAQYTPRGDIGSATDADIAAAVGWPKKPAVLISALCAEKSRWLDPDKEYRLIVHDWPHHCEDSVRKFLLYHRKQFLPVYGPCSAGLRPIRNETAADFQEIPIDVSANFRPSREAKAMAKAVGSSSRGSAEGGVITAEALDQPNPYERLIALWQKPCECCGMAFSCRDVDLGCQVWMNLVDNGTITTANLPEIMAGLARYRASKDWHKESGKYVPSVASWLGWSKDGRPAAPKWRDVPAAKGAYD